jgi:hypothetical protein
MFLQREKCMQYTDSAEGTVELSVAEGTVQLSVNSTVSDSDCQKLLYTVALMY